VEATGQSLVKMLTDENDLVLDRFVGSNTCRNRHAEVAENNIADRRKATFTAPSPAAWPATNWVR
jgi:hypothetical protein